MTTCLSENALLAYVEGRLAVDALLAVERHSGDCARCRELIAVTASALLETAPPVAGEAAAPAASAEEFTGTARYAVERRLGAGAMGVVFAAWDRERGESVALKVLRRADPVALYLFKQEFRALADITHPNLVALHELHADGGHWFFTMDAIDGRPLMQYLTDAKLTPASPAWHEVLRQVALGLGALHDAGKLHRDLKPNNVLVTPAGRVVIVDFGLATDLRHRLTAARPLVAGTPAYMAPEQLVGAELSTASDWYSFGVLLYEALTGELPHPSAALGPAHAFASDAAPPPPSSLAPVPAGLDRLCLRLLERAPRERAGLDEVLAALGPPAPLEAIGRVEGPARAEAPGFVGRARELEALAQARADVAAGHPVVAHVSGPSGIGKTALVQRFLDELGARERVVVIEGRCHERESVPYKALDSVVDQLAQYLLTLDGDAQAALLPDDVALVGELFPVLERVPAVRASPLAGPAREPPDPQERRRRAFASLCRLLGRVAHTALVVIAIDDLQWGDLDSAAFFTQLLGSEGPPLLLIVAHRGGAAEPLVDRLLRDEAAAGVRRHVVEVAPLADEEARRLAATLMSGGDAELVVRESGGSPLFVHELARHLNAGGRLEGAGPSTSPTAQGRLEGARSSTAPTAQVRLEGGVVVEARAATGSLLDGLVRRRLEALPPEAGRLAEVIAVAGHPLPCEVALAAAGLTTTPRRWLGALAAARLAVTRGAGARAEVEPYHDRVREVIVAGLGPAARRIHGALGATLAAAPDAAPRDVLDHFLASDEPERARPYAERAAAAAARSLAFERAAQLYGVAAGLTGDDVERAALLGARAEALAHAGRGGEAGAVYTEAAELRERARGRDRETRAFERRAAEQYLRSGHFDEGIARFRRTLDGAGIRFHASNRAALVALLGWRARLGLRGLRARRPGTVDDATRDRLDTCWAAVVGLSVVDPLRSAYFHTRYLLMALDAGEPERLVRALGVEAVYRSSVGGAARRARGRQLLGVMRTLAAPDDAYARAYCDFVEGTIAFFGGEWPVAAESCLAAARRFRTECIGASWEVGTNLSFAHYALAYLGRLDDLGRSVGDGLRDAAARGDVFVSTTLRVGMGSLALLAADRHAEARAEADEAIAAWTSTVFHSQHYMHLLALAQIELYCGDAAAALARIERAWPELEHSLMLRLPYVRVEARHLRARAALARAADAAAGERERLLRLAQREAERIRHEPLAAAPGFSDAIVAGVAALRGHAAAAAEARARAHRVFAAAGMALYAAATAPAGQAPALPPGATLVDPAAMWRMLAPGLASRSS